LPGDELVLDLPRESDALLAVLDALSTADDAAVLDAWAGRQTAPRDRTSALSRRRGCRDIGDSSGSGKESIVDQADA
jgi:hypothetical protein